MIMAAAEGSLYLSVGRRGIWSKFAARTAFVLTILLAGAYPGTAATREFSSPAYPASRSDQDQSVARTESVTGVMQRQGMRRREFGLLCNAPARRPSMDGWPRYMPYPRPDLSVYTSDGLIVTSDRAHLRSLYCTFNHPYDGLLISCQDNWCWAWLPGRQEMKPRRGKKLYPE
jgi:hypothetical protein